MKAKTFPIFLAFLCMGFGDAVATFVGKAKDTFELSNFEAQIVSFAGFIMFGFLSVPMGVLQSKIGKKATLLSGLGLAFAGVLLVLVLGISSYAVFLAAVLLLGAGAATLQVAGNPIMRDVSREGDYSSNLSLGQFIKAIGSNTAPIVFFAVALLAGDKSAENGTHFEWTLVFAIFAAGFAATMAAVGALKISEKKCENVASVGSCVALLKNPFVFAMVAGIFLYVGAENCVSNGMPIYFTSRFGVSSDLATQYITYFFLAIMFARLAGAAVLKRVEPKKFLAFSAALAVAGFALLFVSGKMLATVALFVIAVGYANIFPLIFSIAIDKMPEKSNELSGLMVTAIVGAAVLPPVMGYAADLWGNKPAFAVPLIATLYVLGLACSLKTAKK